MEVPAPKYLKTDDGAYLAYQVVGDGPVDIAWLSDYSSNIDLAWESLTNAGWFEALTSFGRVILHDRRGTGLSSRKVPIPNLETRAADLRAVLSTVGAEQPVVGSPLGGAFTSRAAGRYRSRVPARPRLVVSVSVHEVGP